MVDYYLGPTSADAVQLYPNPNYQTGYRQQVSDHRTRSGNMFRYKWSEWEIMKLSVDFVSADDMLVVNSWWQSGTKLLFFVESDGACEVHSVMVTNKQTPLDKYNDPYDTLFKGKLTLEGY